MAIESPRRPMVVAHRGASGEAPENTLAAFRLALELGAEGVELDVHLSAEGVPVVLHDALVDRTTDGRGPVRDLSLEALRGLDAGRWFADRFSGERIPTLAEALALLRPVRVIVEIKNGPIYYEGIAREVAAVIRETGHPAVTVSSFDHPVLLEMKELCPRLPTAVLFVARPIDPVRLAKDAGAAYLHPQWAYVTAAMVEQAHRAGLRVEAWTVDDPVVMTRLAEMGVDGIMSNYPGRLRALLTAPQP